MAANKHMETDRSWIWGIVLWIVVMLGVVAMMMSYSSRVHNADDAYRQEVAVASSFMSSHGIKSM